MDMEKLRLVCTLLALALAGCATPPPEQRHSAAELQRYRPADFAWADTATAAERALLSEETTRLRARLALPPGPERDAALPAVLAAVMLFNIEIDAARGPLLAALPGLAQHPADTQRALLTAAYTLYPAEAAPLVKPLLPLLAGPREFAIAAYLLLKADPASAPALREALARRADCCEEPRLRALRLALDPAPQAAPDLAELLATPLRPGYPVVFSLQRPDREAQGLALVRGADGRFLREPDGSLFAVAQLARARSGLPGTISLGNTPRGLYTVQGAGTATNRWIGPTPYLHSKLPVEASLAEFLHQPASGTPWSEASYRALLPAAWQAPLLEAWLAGQAGRSEILMHGTTINPAYYAGTAYFPGTPSAGCLVSSEQWSPEDGRLRASDQLRLAHAFARDGMDRGFLVVAEIGTAGQGAVVLEEVQAAVTKAEQGPPHIRPDAAE